MPGPSYSVESERRDIKEPNCVWESNNISGARFRLVVKYFKEGSAPEIVLERCTDRDALGTDIWLKQDLTNFPKILLEDFARMATGDDDVMKN